MALSACAPSDNRATPTTEASHAPVTAPSDAAQPTTVPQAVPQAAIVATAAPSATAPPASAPTQVLSPIAEAGVKDASVVAAMQSAAQDFLNGLDDAQRKTATYAFDDAERWNWHWAVKPRNGIATANLDAKQLELGWALLRTATTEVGFNRMQTIIEHQDREVGRSNGLYHFTVFGAPEADARWGWRFEGNHISVNAAIVGDQFTLTPFFQGVVPTTAKSGPRPGERILDRLENAARELTLSLGEPERKVAIFQQNSLTDLATGSKRNITPLPATGLALSAMQATQLGLAGEIVNEFMKVMQPSLGGQQRQNYDATNPDQIYFGWAGSLEPNKPQYYRLQGPTFLLEFDNSRNSGTHIHSVWRDFAQDFGDQMQ